MNKSIFAAGLCLLLAAPASHTALVEIWQSPGDLTSLGQADALIAGGGPTCTAEHNDLIDFDDGGDSTRGTAQGRP